jgi:hypothetical protein
MLEYYGVQMKAGIDAAVMLFSSPDFGTQLKV